MTYRFTAILVALVAAGCGGDAQSGASSSHTVSDSSGVTVVANSSGEWTNETRWRIGDSPILEIGVVDGEEPYLFKRIHGVLRLADGSIVAAEEEEVRLYDQDGVHVRSEGREGAGPGEYEYIRAIMQCRPNRFNVYDLSWRESTYTLDGNFVETRQVLPDGIRPYELRCTSSGTFVSLLWAPRTLELPIGLYDTESSLLVGDADVGVDTIMTVSGGQRIGNERGSRPHPFGTVTSFAALGEHIAISTGEKYEYQIYDLRGELLRVVRMPGKDRTISSDDIDAQARKDAQRYPAELFDTYMEQYRNIEMTDRYPAYSEMLVDADKNVWLRHHSRPLDTTQHWDVANAEGILLGTIEFDADAQIVQIGSDFILGHHTTAEGIPQVAMWSLSRGEG